MKELD
ncbi:hypothetical protein BOH78_0623 [Pichia kudriavzevii]